MKFIPYFLLFVLTGCKGDVIEFMNLDFPVDGITEKSFASSQFDEFMVGDILVEPRIMFTHITDSNPRRNYYLGLIFHSNHKDKALPVVKSANLFINGKSVDRDLGITDTRPSPWRVSPYNKDLFISNLEGDELFSASAAADLKKTKISIMVSLKLEVEGAPYIEKEIHCNFSVKKRSRFLQW